MSALTNECLFVGLKVKGPCERKSLFWFVYCLKGGSHNFCQTSWIIIWGSWQSFVIWCDSTWLKKTNKQNTIYYTIDIQYKVAGTGLDKLFIYHSKSSNMLFLWMFNYMVLPQMIKLNAHSETKYCFLSRVCTNNCHATVIYSDCINFYFEVEAEVMEKSFSIRDCN